MSPVRFVLIGFLFLPAALCASTPPDVQEIVRKLAENGGSEHRNAVRNMFFYQRTSRVDYLDEQGRLKNETVRVYEVRPENGKPVAHLMSINGRPITEEQDRNRSSARQTGEKSRSLVLSDDLLSRFDFVYRGEDSVAGRPVWLLDFTPKPDAAAENFMDKLINAMTGTICVDQEEFQLAKANIRLSRKVSFFGGLAGAIEHIDLQLVQKRIEPAAWLTEALTMDFSGRKLLSPIRFRCFENCFDFHKITPARAANP